MENIKSENKSFAGPAGSADPEKRCRGLVRAVLEQTGRLPEAPAAQTMARLLVRSTLAAGVQLWSARWTRERQDRDQISRQALKSVNEIRYWLSLLQETGWPGSDLAGLDRQAAGLAAMLASGSGSGPGKRRNGDGNARRPPVPAG